MRVLHVLSQKPGFTGSGIYLRALLRESAKIGIETAAIVGINSDEDPNLAKCFPVTFESQQLPFPVVGMSDVMPYKASRWANLSESQLAAYESAFSKALREAANTFRPDVIHCHHFWLLTALTRRQFPNERVVASCHGTGLRQQQKLPAFRERLFPALAELDHGYCLTEAHRAELTYLENRSSVVGAGFDPSTFHPNGRPERQGFRMLFAGKIAPSKGCGELLQAVEPLLDKNVTLALAGSGHGAESDELNNRANQIGAELLGRLSHEKLAEEMRRADLFILPSYYEGLPLVVAEALSCGCRVVITKLPGLMSWLPDELVESGWVETVALPRLESADRPLESDIAPFVERLRQAISKQLESSLSRPPGLGEFLREASWTGVFNKISTHYEVENS